MMFGQKQYRIDFFGWIFVYARGCVLDMLILDGVVLIVPIVYGYGIKIFLFP